MIKLSNSKYGELMKYQRLFFKELVEKDFYQLSIKNVAKEFLLFAKRNKINQSDLKTNAKSSNKKLHEYIYFSILFMSKDISQEYKNQLHELQVNKDRVINQITEIYEMKKSAGGYKKKKLDYIFGINFKVLEEINKYLEVSQFKKNIIHDCSFGGASAIISNIHKSISFYNLEQYTDIEWKKYIHFGFLRIGDYEELCKVKKNNYAKFIEIYNNYLIENNIIENMIRIVKSNYYLKDRLEIFKTAIKLFRERKFHSSVALLTIQIEGLFNLFLTTLELKPDSSITDKLTLLNNKKKLNGYIYFAFEFPELRNLVTHGHIIDESIEEVNLDLIALNDYLIRFFDDANNKLWAFDYQKVLSFLKKWNQKYSENTIKNIQSYFKEINYSKEIFKRLINGEYDKVISYYNLSSKKRIMRNYFKSNYFTQNYKFLGTENQMNRIAIAISDEIKMNNIVLFDKDITAEQFKTDILTYESPVKIAVRKFYSDLQ